MGEAGALGLKSGSSPRTYCASSYQNRSKLEVANCDFKRQPHLFAAVNHLIPDEPHCACRLQLRHHGVDLLAVLSLPSSAPTCRKNGFTFCGALLPILIKPF
jgi:hypothetical protein